MIENPYQSLPVFTEEEHKRAKLYLATRVAVMMGRKLEEGDWSHVYCAAKKIPESTWSNLNIDINYQGLGVEQKLLRVEGNRPIKSYCGTTQMHPAATRSIRIADVEAPADEVMVDVFAQYANLIQDRTESVRKLSAGIEPDMRIGWLIWESNLAEFLYFEQRWFAPNPENFYAVWNETQAKGTRKSSKSLWIYEKGTDKKRFSVTTSAGIKIQPYFDIPAPNDPNLCYFRVQGEPLDDDTVLVWVTASTARALKEVLGSLQKEIVSDAIQRVAASLKEIEQAEEIEDGLAKPIYIDRRAYTLLTESLAGVNDEHRMQLIVDNLKKL